jgi:hypothetical protein
LLKLKLLLTTTNIQSINTHTPFPSFFFFFLTCSTISTTAFGLLIGFVSFLYNLKKGKRYRLMHESPWGIMDRVRAGLDWIGLDWIGLVWFGLDWFALKRRQRWNLGASVGASQCTTVRIELLAPLRFGQKPNETSYLG